MSKWVFNLFLVKLVSLFLFHFSALEAGTLEAETFSSIKENETIIDNRTNFVSEDGIKWIGAISRADSNIPEGRVYHTPAISEEMKKQWEDTDPLSKRSIYLRREFSATKSIKSAVVNISGLGHYELTLNAMKSNMHAVFTDCPHREKLGWLEQVHLNGPGLFYNFDLSTFAPKIMQDIRDAQLDNGLVPDIAPEYVIFDGGFRDSPEWGSTAVDHIVSHGLGDWCDFREDEPYGVSHNTPVPLSATTHYYMVIDYLVQAAQIVGNANDEEHYSKLRSGSLNRSQVSGLKVIAVSKILLLILNRWEI